jgi:hypothetical protein
MPIFKKLHEITEKITAPENAYFHFLDPNDVTDSPQGSDFRISKANLSGDRISWSTFKLKKKGYGNTLQENQIGDIFEGWISNGIYAEHAVWDGVGQLDNPNSFNIKTITEH